MYFLICHSDWTTQTAQTATKKNLTYWKTEIKEIKDKDKSLYYVLESIVEQNKDFKNCQLTATEVLRDEKNRFINCYK